MQLDQNALIEEAVQASIDAGLAVNGEYGVAAARHAARFMFNALQAVQPVPVVKIKPLEWRDHRGHTFPDTWTALTPCGVFEIEERSAGDSPAYFATGPMYAFIADKDSLEEAKAAAQADYERRISASLSATASAEPEASVEPKVLVALRNEVKKHYRDGKSISWENKFIADGLRDAIQIVDAYIRSTTFQEATMPSEAEIDALIERLSQFEGRDWETTACYNGLRLEAAAFLAALRDERDMVM